MRESLCQVFFYSYRFRGALTCYAYSEMRIIFVEALYVFVQLSFPFRKVAHEIDIIVCLVVVFLDIYHVPIRAGEAQSSVRYIAVHQHDLVALP